MCVYFLKSKIEQSPISDKHEQIYFLEVQEIMEDIKKRQTISMKQRKKKCKGDMELFINFYSIPSNFYKMS